jgi:hypothetical protein
MSLFSLEFRVKTYGKYMKCALYPYKINRNTKLSLNKKLNRKGKKKLVAVGR